MDRQRDLELILRAKTPIVVIETRDEKRMLDLLGNITRTAESDDYRPLFVKVMPVEYRRALREMEEQRVGMAAE